MTQVRVRPLCGPVFRCHQWWWLERLLPLFLLEFGKPPLSQKKYLQISNPDSRTTCGTYPSASTAIKTAPILRVQPFHFLLLFYPGGTLLSITRIRLTSRIITSFEMKLSTLLALIMSTALLSTSTLAVPVQGLAEPAGASFTQNLGSTLHPTVTPIHASASHRKSMMSKSNHLPQFYSFH